MIIPEGIPRPLTVQLDRASARPLYRQLHEVLRYRILSGVLVEGVALPAIREAGELWGLHHHTVRRAYGQLAQEGLVESRRGVGTTVLPPRFRRTSLPDRVARFLHEVSEEYGADAEDVVRVLRSQNPRSRGGAPLWAVECSLSLGRALAEFAEVRGAADARGWPLDRLASLPDGPVLSTHFHADAVVAALPDRVEAGAVEFVAVQPDVDALLSRLGPGIETVVLCDLDRSTSHALLEDLRATIATARSVPVAVRTLGALPSGHATAATPVVYSPGCWDALAEADRMAEGAILLPVRISPADEGRLSAFLMTRAGTG